MAPASDAAMMRKPIAHQKQLCTKVAEATRHSHVTNHIQCWPSTCTYCTAHLSCEKCSSGQVLLHAQHSPPHLWRPAHVCAACSPLLPAPPQHSAACSQPGPGSPTRRQPVQPAPRQSARHGACIQQSTDGPWQQQQQQYRSRPELTVHVHVMAAADTVLLLLLPTYPP